MLKEAILIFKLLKPRENEVKAFKNYFVLLSVAKNCKDGHGLELTKVGPTFSSFNAIPGKSLKKLLCLLLPDQTCLISSSHVHL